MRQLLGILSIALAVALVGCRAKTVADYDKSLSSDIASGGLSGDALAEAYIKRGTLRLSNNEVDAAIADFDKAVEAAPKMALAYADRANALSVKGERDRAIADYTALIGILPASDPSGYLLRGNALAEKGDQTRAIADFDRVLQINPKFWVAHALRGEALSELGELDRALADLDQAIAESNEPVMLFATTQSVTEPMPKGPPAIGTKISGYRVIRERVLAAVYLAQGKIRLRQQRYDLALPAFDSALALAPKNSQAQVHRGLTKLALGQCSAGLDDLRSGAASALVGTDAIVKQHRTFIDQTPCAAQVL